MMISRARPVSGLKRPSKHFRRSSALDDELMASIVEVLGKVLTSL